VKCPHVPPLDAPLAVGDLAPSAVWTFVGGLIVAGIRIHDALTLTARGTGNGRRPTEPKDGGR
jgi:hypothetical protein